MQSVKMTGANDMQNAYELSGTIIKNCLGVGGEGAAGACYNNFIKNMNFNDQFKDNCKLLGGTKNRDSKCINLKHPPIFVDKILYMWDKKPNDDIYTLGSDKLTQLYWDYVENIQTKIKNYASIKDPYCKFYGLWRFSRIFKRRAYKRPVETNQ